jgi:hypothetical protein
MRLQPVFFLLWSPGTVRLCAISNHQVEVRCQLNEPSATMERRVWLRMGKLDHLVTVQVQSAHGNFDYFISEDDGCTFSALHYPGARANHQAQLHSDGSVTVIEERLLYVFWRKTGRWISHQLPPGFIGTGTALGRDGCFYVVGRALSGSSSRPQIVVIGADTLVAKPVGLGAWKRLSIAWHCAREPEWFIAAEAGRSVIATQWYTGIDMWTMADDGSRTLFLIENDTGWHKLVLEGTAFLIRQGMPDELLIFSSTGRLIRTHDGGKTLERRDLAAILAKSIGVGITGIPTITAMACMERVYVAAVTWYETVGTESIMVESQLVMSQDGGLSFERLARYESSSLEIRDVALAG